VIPFKNVHREDKSYIVQPDATTRPMRAAGPARSNAVFVICLACSSYW
jgi:hypothetical protein